MLTRSIGEMLAEPAGYRVIDVRREEDFLEDTLEGAVWIPLDALYDRRGELEKDKPVYLLCYNGRRAEPVAQRLAEDGYRAYVIAQGYYALVKYRLEQKASGEDPDQTRCREIERSIIKTYRKEIWRRFTRAVNTYELIRDGDRIAVCISGGKDSMLMAKLFQELKRHGKNNFETVFLVMNPGYHELNAQVIRDNAALMQIPISVFDSEIYNIVAEQTEGSPCYLCARMRRGNLYAKAKELGCNKIALGHHYDDVIETILMGMLYGGQIQTMMPKLKSTNFPGMELIRPLYLIREDDIKRWRDLNGLHFIRCACRLTEQCELDGTESARTGHKRTEIKELIRTLARRSPYIEQNIFKSVENVHMNAVIAYRDTQGRKRHFLERYEEGRNETEQD